MDTNNSTNDLAARADLNVRLTRVETIPLRIPLNIPVKIASGAARPAVEVMLVRLHTDAGVVGIGETQAWRREGSSETLASLACVINDHFAPLIVGRSPFAIAAIMRELDAAVYHSLYAQAPISDALYDLQGKLLGVPVHTLLGGKCRDTVSSCGVLFIQPTLAATLAGADALYQRGFRSFTIKVGADLKADVQNVRALRERYGDDLSLRIDANAGTSFDDALALLRKLEPYAIDAAEQMLPIWDLDGMAALARRVDVPLIADECVTNVHDLMAVIRQRAATAVQTKIAKNGGIWYSRKLWQVADAAGMHIYPGNHPGTSIATMAAAHLAAAWPGALREGPFTVGICALREDVVTQPLRLEGNQVRVSDAPGLGVTLDEERIRKLRVDI